MFFRSIRFKITILYMAILALTLTTFSIILHHNVGAGLYNNMDTLLKSKAGGVAKAIDTYWQTANLEAMESGEVPETLVKRRNINFAKMAQRWVREESTDPALLDIIVKVFDTDGRAIAFSKNTASLSGIPKKDFLSVLQGQSRFDKIMNFRFYTTPVIENDKVAYIVQVASPLASIQTALNNLKLALLILFPITVIVTGMMGTFLAKVTLHPVDSMIKTIHQITAENMKLKIAIPDTKDEIQKLAETFNNMLRRLESAFVTQRQLFEDLSHELKTPLTILKGEFEVVLKKIRSQQEYESSLRSSLEEINRLSRLAENLLLLARFDSSGVWLDKKRLDLNQLIKTIINNIRGLVELKEINIVFSPKGEIALNGDESQLKTLFLNIIDNAVKYTPQKGSVEISTETNNSSSAKVLIRDTGIGIPEGQIGRIFDRFYRVDGSRNSAGFGLGLSIAKSIAESHGGKIEVGSEPGKGTTFTVLLPLY